MADQKKEQGPFLFTGQPRYRAQIDSRMMDSSVQKRDLHSGAIESVTFYCMRCEELNADSQANAVVGGARFTCKKCKHSETIPNNFFG